ncbi:MAG: c-type cytochrome domain-containing protein [Verrucomicrobiota bacterium]
MLKRLFRRRLLIASFATLASVALTFSSDAATAVPGKLRFNESIRPILSNNCFQCHGPDEKKREAELRLDTFEGATRDLGGYRAIKPGAPEKSALLERILSHDRDEVMPPPKSKKPPITPNEIALLRQWIAEGAQYEGHWAFQPLSQDPPPVVAKSSWVRNPIDQFILSEL